MAFVAAGALAACGGSQEAALSANAPIGIETTQFGVTLENRSGMPLVGLNVVVQAPGMDFTTTIARLENADHQEVPIDDFTSHDGTHLNLRVEQPRTVHVTAKDITDKPYDVTAPWR